MTTRIFSLVILISAMAFNAIAHNVKIATYTLRDTGFGWFIEMNFTQVAIDAQMLKLYDEATLAAMDEATYKRSFLTYLRDHFHLRVDGEKVEFLSGGILLGSHQTDVKYVLPQIPAEPQSISVYLPMFEDVYNQTNLFRIYRGGKTFTKFFLNADNAFSTHMEFTSEGIVEIEKPAHSNHFAMISGSFLLILLVLLIVGFLYKRFSVLKV